MASKSPPSKAPVQLFHRDDWTLRCGAIILNRHKSFVKAAIRDGQINRNISTGQHPVRLCHFCGEGGRGIALGSNKMQNQTLFAFEPPNGNLSNRAPRNRLLGPLPVIDSAPGYSNLNLVIEEPTANHQSARAEEESREPANPLTARFGCFTKNTSNPDACYHKGKAAQQQQQNSRTRIPGNYRLHYSTVTDFAKFRG